jgi:small subunit ribosomal protein S2
MKKEISIPSLMEAGAHYGYSRARRHPSVSKYVYGTKNGSDIIDLEKTVVQIQHAVEFLHTLAANGKTVLLVGVKPEAQALIQNMATALKLPFVTERWIGGMLTNFSEIKRRIQKLEDMRLARTDGSFEKYTKKEQIMLSREMARLEKYFAGMVGMHKMPDALLIVDQKKEHIATTEAHKLSIPVITIGNTDASIRAVDYPIVANDSATTSISAIIAILTDALKA